MYQIDWKFEQVLLSSGPIWFLYSMGICSVIHKIIIQQSRFCQIAIIEYEDIQKLVNNLLNATQHLAQEKLMKITTMLLSVLIASCTISAKKGEVIAVGVYDNKPLVFTTNDSKVQGVFIDLLDAIAAKEDWQLNYIVCAWSDCLEQLSDSKLDLLVGIAFSPERASRFRYNSEVILRNWGQIFARADAGIESVLDLASRRVAVKVGDIHFQALRELTTDFGLNCTFVEVDSYPAMFDMLDNGQVDAVATNRLFGRGDDHSSAVVPTPIMFNPVAVHIAAPPGADPGVLETIDAELKAWKADPTSLYHQVIGGWIMDDTHLHRAW